MNNKYKIILMLLIVIIAISSYFIIKKFAENKKETDIYEDLQEIVIEQNDENINIIENEQESNEKDSRKNYNLENIAKINSDVIGWLKIDGTKIDYPIMQNGDYYLHKNIYKQYSSHGTPYLAEYCNVQYSDNLIIYGHHMSDNSMFAQLENYKKKKFYENHKYIDFYTFYNGKTIKNTYEIIIAFKTVVYTDNGFKYYNYTNFTDKQEFDEFINNAKALQFYDTGTDIKYGDKLITLSTCEYSQKNGRMVVVAKKI